jgi:hypothetical protein
LKITPQAPCVFRGDLVLEEISVRYFVEKCSDTHLIGL